MAGSEWYMPRSVMRRARWHRKKGVTRTSHGSHWTLSPRTRMMCAPDARSNPDGFFDIEHFSLLNGLTQVEMENICHVNHVNKNVSKFHGFLVIDRGLMRNNFLTLPQCACQFAEFL